MFTEVALKSCRLWKADICAQSRESFLDALKVKTRLGIKRHLSMLNAPVRLDIQKNAHAGTLNLLLVLKDCFGISSCQCGLQLHVRH